MSSFLFLLIFGIIFLLLELYVFRILFQFFINGNSATTDQRGSLLGGYFRDNKSITLTSVYWIFIIALPVNMYLHLKGFIDPYDFKPWIYVNAFFFIFAITRFTIALFSGIADITSFLTNYIGGSLFSEPYNPGRKKFLRKIALLGGMLPFPTLMYGMIRNPYRYRVMKNTIAIPKLKSDLEGLRIVQISDIHAGSWVFKSPVETAIKMINELDADIVFFTGDLVNYRASEMQPYIDLFSKIKSRYGTYSILGNHDYGDYFRWDSEVEKEENFQQLLEAHKLMGWNLLMNENSRIQIGKAELAIIGVENYSALPQFPRYGNLSLAYEGSQSADLRILLSHDPTHWDVEVRNDFPGIEITLSGHTHGFQFGFEIPGFIKWSPSSLFYNQWAGLYRENDSFLYVNRGLGYLGYPGRVGILPEITLIELKKRQKEAV